MSYLKCIKVQENTCGKQDTVKMQVSMSVIRTKKSEHRRSVHFHTCLRQKMLLQNGFLGAYDLTLRYFTVGYGLGRKSINKNCPNCNIHDY